jgi:phosphoribosylformylglycinamidine (FGAM) synthase-like enzyme
LLVALAESMIGGRMGASINMQGDDALFSEAPGRFIVSIPPDQQEVFENLMKGHNMQQIGETMDEPVLALPRETIPLDQIVTAWKKGF